MRRGGIALHAVLHGKRHRRGQDAGEPRCERDPPGRRPPGRFREAHPQGKECHNQHLNKGQGKRVGARRKNGHGDDVQRKRQRTAQHNQVPTREGKPIHRGERQKRQPSSRHGDASPDCEAGLLPRHQALQHRHHHDRQAGDEPRLGCRSILQADCLQGIAGKENHANERSSAPAAPPQVAQPATGDHQQH